MDSVHVRTTALSERNEKYFDILAADESYLGPDFDLARYQDVVRKGNHFTVQGLANSIKLQTIVALLLKGIPSGRYAVESYFMGSHSVIADFLETFRITEEEFITKTLSEQHLIELAVSPLVIQQITDSCERIERAYGRNPSQDA
jgi:hypothetical protein